AARKILRLTGTLLSNNDITARANAISVAIGIAHPEAVSYPEFNAKNIAAGTSAPPTAQSIGIIAFFGDDSSPSTISLLISSPTNRKKTAIRPSFIHIDTE